MARPRGLYRTWAARSQRTALPFERTASFEAHLREVVVRIRARLAVLGNDEVHGNLSLVWPEDGPVAGKKPLDRVERAGESVSKLRASLVLSFVALVCGL